MNRLSTVLSACLMLAACRGPSASDYQAIHKDGLRKNPYASDLTAQYALVDHFITNFGFSKQPLVWNSRAFIHDRFTLSITIPVNVDYRAKTVTLAGDPEFFLHAPVGISSPVGGRTSASFDTELQRNFGLAEWTKFKAAGFDLRVLGIPAAEIRPEKDFRDYVSASRRDIIPIK